MKKILVFTIILVCALTFLQKTPFQDFLRREFVVSTPQKAATTSIIASDDQDISLKKMIGQLVIIGATGEELSETDARFIREYGVSGFNLIGKNSRSRTQVTALINDLQNEASEAGIPGLFVGVDQEGGAIERFKFLGTHDPQSALTSTTSAYRVAYTRGVELRKTGVNMVFAPVLDLVTDSKSYLYGRTFQTTPENIALRGSAMVNGFHEAGIIAVPKHFPGYGNLKLDPHTSSATAAEGYSLEKNLQPFILAYRNTSFEALMTAHITVPQYDTKPATRSSYMLTTLLRNSLGFKGVIVSDDLEMASVGDDDDIGKSAVESIQAGADLLIVTQKPANQTKVLTALTEAVSTGELSAQRVRESYARVMELKRLYGLAKTSQTR